MKVTKKNILFIYPEMMMGGSTTSLINLLNEIDYEKYNVDIAFRKKRGTLYDDIPSQVNILCELDSFPSGIFGKILKFILLIFNFKFYLSIFQKIKKNNTAFNQIAAYNQVFFCRKIKKQYDCAISFLEGFSNIYVNSKKVRANKKINWIHTDYKIAGFNIKYDLEHLKKADNIIFVSNVCLCHFRALAPELSKKLKVIENVVSHKLIKKKASMGVIDDVQLNEIDCMKILTVCRLSTHTKGLDRIFNVVSKLVNDGFKFKWGIIGGNPDNEFNNLYEKFEYKDNLILFGEKINPFSYFKYFDFFVLPSRFEGKPMVVTEALLLGLPVITTRYSSASEQIDNNVNGIIVDNNEISIYNILKNILLNSEIMNDLKKNLAENQEKIRDSMKFFDDLVY